VSWRSPAADGSQPEGDMGRRPARIIALVGSTELMKLVDGLPSTVTVILRLAAPLSTRPERLIARSAVKDLHR
jgi:hypothetical protein